MTEIITRQYAIANGLGKYFTGKPCRKGHIAERWIAGACTQCVSERKKELYQENKEQVLAYMKVQGAIYRKNNPEKRLENSYKWREENRERVREQEKQRRLVNPERYKSVARKHYYNNLEKQRTRAKEWRDSNKGLINYYTSKRKAAKLQRTPEWLTEDDRWMIEQAYELAAQRTAIFGFPWHVDHVLPLRGKTVSGLHVPTNLRVIPGVENMRKGNRL